MRYEEERIKSALSILTYTSFNPVKAWTIKQNNVEEEKKNVRLNMWVEEEKRDKQDKFVRIHLAKISAGLQRNREI